MESFFQTWLLLVVVFSTGLISPGPDFVMAVRNSILYSRKVGVFTAIGFGLGVLVHVGYSIAGLALIISQSVLLFNIIKYIGAGYLIYMGYNALKSKGFDIQDSAIEQSPIKTISPYQALQSGFITNLFNPKATLFFLALFTQIIQPDMPIIQKTFCGLTCAVLTMMWFSFVAVVLTTPKIRNRFLKISKWVDKVCGVLFIGLAIKLLLTRHV